MATTLDCELLRDLFGSAEVREAFDSRALLQGWLDAERALAEGEAEAGVIPGAAALRIARECDASLYDLAALREGIAETQHPLVPLVRALSERCGEEGGWVHWGATTQDIIDTGMVLQVRTAHEILRRDLVALILELSDLAETHRATVMAGRTHAQQALPITFGFKVATWIAECVRQVERLDEAAPRLFVGELGGAVGTLAGFGPQGEAVQRKALERLGLGVPPIAWHASRDTIAEFVVLLALIGGTLARIANEVIQLQRSEIMELEEPFTHGKVGSSTMPHKRNPAHAERIVAIGRLLRGLAATALETTVAAHERDMSVGRAEWVLVPEAACLAAAAEHWSLVVVRGLRVNADRMKENLHRTGGLLLSEAVMLRLGEVLGRNVAHDLVYDAAMGAFEGRGSFRERLLADSRIAGALSEGEIDRLLEPTTYTGLAGTFVDRVVREARRLNA